MKNDKFLEKKFFIFFALLFKITYSKKFGKNQNKISARNGTKTFDIIT